MVPRQTRQGGGALEGSTAFFRAKEQALRFLAYRARSEAEVRRRLSRKYSQSVVEDVLEALRSQNYLDDLAFSMQWRASRERFKPRAGRLIRQELRGFGVSAEVIEDALAGFDDEANAGRAAGSFARRRARPDMDWSEFREKLTAHLRRRGFAPWLAAETAGRAWEELRTDPLYRQCDPNEDEEQFPQAVYGGAEDEGYQESDDHRTSGKQGQENAPLAVDGEAQKLGGGVTQAQTHQTGYEGETAEERVQKQPRHASEESDGDAHS